MGAKAGTQNIDRILRLPGTTNLPNAKKRREGRVVCPARLLAFNERVHPLDAFPLPAQQAANPGKNRTKLPRIDFSNLPDVDFSALQVSEKMKAAIDTDGSDLGNGDRSKGAARVAWALARAGLPDPEIASVFWHEPIGAHCHDQKDPERAICRAIAFARQSDAANEFDTAESDQTEGSRRDKWGDPADLWEKRTEQPAALPPDTVPGLIWQFAADRSRRLGVGPGAPAAALITTLGSLVPAEAVIQPRQRDTKWTVKPILWTMLIGAPGSNKTAVLAQAMAPIQELEREWRAEFQRAKSQHQAAREFPSVKPKTQEASAVLEDRPAAAEPRCRRKVANDATTEALAELLAKNSGGLLYFAEELAGLFGSMDVYRQRSGKDRAFWLQAKDGGPITVDRKTQSSVYASNCAVGVLGSIQPDKLAAIAANLTNDGLLQRFTPVFIDRKSDGEDLDPDEALDRLVLQVARSIAASSAGHYRLSPEADAELHSILRFKNDGIIDRGDADPIACQWLEKLPNEFARTALVFHFIEWFSNEEACLLGDDPPAVISAETARRACRYLTEFVFSHAQGLYRAVGDGATDKHAQWIGGFILARELKEIDERAVYRVYAALRSREKRSAIFGTLRVLELLDWVRPTAFRPNGQAKCWSVNPAVHEGRFADRATSERQRRTEFCAKMKSEGGIQ